MTEAKPLDREAQIRQHIKEAQASWETQSRRIEAVQRDLALALDGQRRVVLQEQLRDLAKERVQLESRLQLLERELEAVSAATFERIEFVNRENELRLLDLERLKASRSPYTLISAPAGYGKSDLLRRLVAEGQAAETTRGRWAFCSVDVAAVDGDQIALITQSIAGRHDLDADGICDTVIRELAAPAPEGRKAVLLVFDGVERLAEDARQWLYAFFDTLHQRTRMGHLEIIVVRTILAGRNPDQFWEGYERAFAPLLAPQRIRLSPFDEHPIQELVWSQAQAVQIPLDDQLVAQIADEVQHLSGGHPGAIRCLVDHLAEQAFAIGSPQDYFARHRKALVRRYISPVVDGLLSGFDGDLAAILRTLSVFRRINANTVQGLVEAGELATDTNEIGLLAEIQKANVLSSPTIQEPFYRDTLMRRVVAIHMAYATEATAARYQRLNKVALDLYDNWILNLGKALPDSVLRSTQRLLSVVEWFFHALQDRDMQTNSLHDALQGYVRALSSGAQSVPVADLIADQIRRDSEIRYLVRHRTADTGFSSLDDWLRPSS